MGSEQKARKDKKAASAKEGAQDLAIEQRRGRVVELRLRAKSMRAIAAELGVSVGTVHSDLEEVLVRSRDDANDKVQVERETSIGRIELAIEAIMPDVLDGSLEAADRLVKLEGRLAKLKGTDAPTKTEISGPEGAPVEVSVQEGLTKKLQDLGQRLAGSGTQPS